MSDGTTFLVEVGTEALGYPGGSTALMVLAGRRPLLPLAPLLTRGGADRELMAARLASTDADVIEVETEGDGTHIVVPVTAVVDLAGQDGVRWLVDQVRPVVAELVADGMLSDTDLDAELSGLLDAEEDES